MLNRASITLIQQKNSIKVPGVRGEWFFLVGKYFFKIESISYNAKKLHVDKAVQSD